MKSVKGSFGDVQKRATLFPDTRLPLGAVFAWVIAWMAGLFYLSRLLVYRVERHTPLRKNFWEMNR